MAAIAKSWFEWLEQHAQKGPDGVWRCTETKKEIVWTLIARTITWKSDGAVIEVRKVLHPHCSRCTPRPQFPEYGSQIFEDELVNSEGKPATLIEL